MIHSSEDAKLTRRTFMTATGVAAAASGLNAAAGSGVEAKAGTIRDHLWLFTVPANTDFGSVQRRSLMTPAESGLYFDIPNLIIVQASQGESKYGRFEPPFAQYGIALRPFKRIVWSVTGSGGFNSDVETREVMGLAKSMSNFTGIMLDDFFSSKKEGKKAVFTAEELGRIRQELKSIGSRLDILATYYTQLLELDLSEYLKLIDVLTLWTWRSAEIPDIEKNLSRLDKLAPNARKMLGCYLYDFDLRKSVAIPAMEQQCETGLRLLKQKRIEGMIFLSNTVADLGFESVEWTRNWIRKVGDTRV
jgi:hypothetical protein